MSAALQNTRRMSTHAPRMAPKRRPVPESDHEANARQWTFGGEVESRPFCDYQAECDCCAALMLGNQTALETGIHRLKAAFFDAPLHRAVFEAVLQLYQRRHTHDEVLEIEPIIVAQQLQKTGLYSADYGDAYIREMLWRCPSAANVGFYIDTIIEAWGRRQLWYLARHVARSTMDATQTINTMRGAADAIERGDAAGLETLLRETN